MAAAAGAVNNNADSFKLTAVANFTRSFSENEIVQWIITPEFRPPAFDQTLWNKLYSKSEYQELALAFTLVDALKPIGISRVELTVTYPTKKTGNTHVFLPEDKMPTWRFTAPGEVVNRKYDPNYVWDYVVYFDEFPNDPYRSGPLPSNQTQIVIPAAALGTQKATFIGSNIDFGTSPHQVSYVEIEFYPTPPLGKPAAAVRRGQLKDNTTSLRLDVRNGRPSPQDFAYQLRYVLNDRNVFRSAPTALTAPFSSDPVIIASPYQNLETFPVINNFAAVGKKTISRLIVSGKYADPLNGFGASQSWNVEAGNPPKDWVQGKEWPVKAVGSNTAAVTWNGFAQRADGVMLQFRNVVMQLSDFAAFFANPAQMPYSVVVDPQFVDWNEVGLVRADVWTLNDQHAPLISQYVLHEMLEDGSGEIGTIQTFQFLKAMPSQSGLIPPSPTQTYLFFYDPAKTATYYYKVTYFQKDGTPRYAESGSGQSTQLLVLPPNGSSKSSVINTVTVGPDHEFALDPRKALAAI